jgi:DNA polymerase III sliding clamp (beta) subunit (PCNA family)
MKLKLKTVKLQEVISKAVKGASNNKMIPITSLLCLELKDNTLTVTTTDATNYLKIISNKVEGEDFYIVVQSEIFSKLVSKISVEYINLELKDNSLEIIGNGTYQIELPLDEEGKLIRFPEYKFDTTVESKEINLSTMKMILNTNKAAVAQTMEVPCLTGYYFGADVITTDSFKVCAIDVDVFKTSILLSPELISILDVFSDEKITVQQNDSKILFTTDNAIAYGSQLDGIADYPYEAIQAYLNTKFTSSCKLIRGVLLNVLERLSLFVSPYDKNGLYLTFTTEGIMISSKKSNGTELIKYQGSENFKPFTCSIDIEMLTSQIAALDSDHIELWYDNDKAIKITTDRSTQIIALLEDDRTVNG